MTEPFRVLVTASRLWDDPDWIGREMNTVMVEHPKERLVLVHGQCDPRARVGKHALIPWAAAERMPCDRQMILLGGDWLADRIAGRLGWAIERHPADWAGPCDPQRCPPEHRRTGYRGEYCPAAGAYRNADMAKDGIHLGLAFILNGSNGASDCARATKAAGVETRRFTAEGDHR